MRTKLVPCIVAAALALSACSDDYGSDGSPAAAESGAEAAGSEIAAQALVQTGQTPLGDVLTTTDGMTLYGRDVASDAPPCEGDCAATWPPVTVDSAELPEGLDPAVFGVVPRSDGTYQLTAGGTPLYQYAGDSAPGDTNGQGESGVWYAIGPAGELVRDAIAPPSSPAEPEPTPSAGSETPPSSTPEAEAEAEPSAGSETPPSSTIEAEPEPPADGGYGSDYGY